MKIDAQCRNFKFLENKLSQIACDDIKWNENKAFWSKKIRSTLIRPDRARRSLDKSTLYGLRNCRHNEAKA